MRSATGGRADQVDIALLVTANHRRYGVPEPVAIARLHNSHLRLHLVQKIRAR